MASIDRTAYPRFKRVVSARELAEAFTPTADEVEWARSKTATEQHFLALVVLLKCYQRLGYFSKLADVPPAVVDHVRGKLELDEAVEAAHESDRTLWRHRDFVRTRLGVKYTPATVRAVADAAIRKVVQSKNNPADLINVALDELVRQSCELPGYTTLDAMAASIRAEVNGGMFTAVADRPGRMQRTRLERLLWVDPASRRSEFDRLKDSAQAATLGKFKQRLAYLAWLDGLGPTEQWLEGIPPGKIAHFAGEARVTDAADMCKVLNDDKRLTLLISLVHECRTAARDEVVTMFCKRMAALHKKGRERLEEIQTANRAETERLIGVFGEVLAAAREATTPAATSVSTPELAAGSVAGIEGPGLDAGSGVGGVQGGVEERAGRLVLKTLADAGGIDELATAAEAVSAYHGNNYLPLLERFYRSHRPVLFTLVDAIELEATSADRSVLDAVEFIRANRDRRSDWLPETITVGTDGQPTTLTVNVDAFASDAWEKVLRDRQRPGMLARRHLEICVFSYLAAELRSGDIAVAGSDSYANLHAQLMSWDECAPLAADFCAQAGIPTEATELVAHYRHELTRTAAAVDAGYPANTDLVLDGDRPVLKRRKGADRRSSAVALEAAIHQRLPERSLLDILTRTAYLTGWHRHFGPTSGSDPKVRDTLGRYVTTTYAYGTNLGPAEVARHMRGRVSAHEIYTAGNKHSDPSKVYRGSMDVINEFAKLDVAGIWGDGQVVAVDGSQVDTWENNLLAESHIRYGGYGGIAMRHVADSYIALFSHFIPCGVWGAIYIIEGLLNNDSDIQPEAIHADTQGQSLPVFGLAALLGFELLPRIRNWHDLIFYRPDPRTRYQHIDALFGDNAIDWDLIERHWTDLLRTAISIRESRVSSVTLLRRLGNHSRKNRLYRAFRELGRVIMTITLLRFLSEPELREQITAITNKAEAFHGYAEWLMVGGKLIGHNDPDHQELVVKFNELMANCAIYSTALDITDVTNALAAEGHPVDHDDLATITPTSPTPSAASATWCSISTHPTRFRSPDWTWNPAPCSPAAPPPDGPDGVGVVVGIVERLVGTGPVGVHACSLALEKAPGAPAVHRGLRGMVLLSSLRTAPSHGEVGATLAG
ncbi:Tn3 family transposase [Haloactinomyces albus]|uniref:TnpA family transposase n=1 Tax=Haloactinomyces albus TaxID=1352928 RepID=A0AAE4CNI8_9ACTN|nr:Tn3 family transposase [Haloactinomyces albus]MDR7304480.1 TnpA family transposase [Haloactinomyces albus]